MSSPLVSVLMTVFNREKYLATAIESVLAQGMKDFELIIVDDCSSDRSMEIAHLYEDNPRVRLFKNDYNLGDYPNRNCAANYAKGKYIKYVDADDLIYPHCLEVMVETMEKFPEAAYGLSIDDSSFGVLPLQLSSREAYYANFIDNNAPFTLAPLKAIIKRNFFERIGGFRNDGRCTSDTTCWLELSARWPVVLIIGGLTWWRKHPDQESAWSRSHWEAQVEVAARTFRVEREHLESHFCPLLPNERCYVLRQLHLKMLRRVAWHFRYGRAKSAFSEIIQGKIRPSDLLKSIIPTTSKFNLEPIPNPPHLDLKLSSLPDWPVFPGKPRMLNSFDSSKAKTSNSYYKQKIKNREQTNIQEKNAPDKHSQKPDNYSHLTIKPLVSVLIPSYNAEKYIKEAIESVIAQRLKDWELIIVDDASTDRTYNIAKTYEDRDQIRCYRNDYNLGKWANHNRCAELAKGKYLKFLHADDLLYPHCLEFMVHMMERHHVAGLGISAPVGPFQAGVCLEPKIACQSEFLSTPRFLEGPTALILKSDSFHHVDGFDDRFEPAERHLQLKLASKFHVVLINRGLTWYRRYSAVTYLLSEKHFLGRAAGIPWILEYLKSQDCPLSPREREDAIRNLRLVSIQAARSRFRLGHLSEVNRILRMTGLPLNCLFFERSSWCRAPESFYELAFRINEHPLDPQVFPALKK